jgi:hypothetical protein
LSLAVSIVDRYLNQLTINATKAPPVTELSVVSCVLAAKLEQPISPSYNKMIGFLPENQKTGVSKKELLRIEREVIKTLQFDIQRPGPTLFIERYIKVLGYERIEA